MESEVRFWRLGDLSWQPSPAASQPLLPIDYLHQDQKSFRYQHAHDECTLPASGCSIAVPDYSPFLCNIDTAREEPHLPIAHPPGG